MGGALEAVRGARGATSAAVKHCLGRSSRRLPGGPPAPPIPGGPWPLLPGLVRCRRAESTGLFGEHLLPALALWAKARAETSLPARSCWAEPRGCPGGGFPWDGCCADSLCCRQASRTSVVKGTQPVLSLLRAPRVPPESSELVTAKLCSQITGQ